MKKIKRFINKIMNKLSSKHLIDHSNDNFNKLSDNFIHQMSIANEELANLKQTINMLSNKIKSGKVVNFAIIIHNIEAIDSVKSIINEMYSDERFNVIVFSCNRRFPGEKNFIDEDKVHQYLDSNNITHVRLNNESGKMNLDLIKSFLPDGLLRQSQWDADFPPELSTDNLRFCRLYYVPYEIMNFLSGVDENVNNSYFHQSCRAIFSANKYSAFEDSKFSIKKNQIPLGHPKVKELTIAKPYWPVPGDFKLKVIWGAHHSIFKGWSDFGTFIEAHKTILEFCKKNSDISIVFSPHPALVTILNNSDPELKNEYEKFKLEWDELPNTCTRVFSSYGDIFSASDLLLIDGISWLLEYQLQNKPIIFMEREGHLPFDKSGLDISRGVYSVKNSIEAINTILEFKNGKIHEKKGIQKEICELYLNSKGDPALNIINYIYSDIVNYD